VQLIRVGEDSHLQYTPPPDWAEFPVIVQSVRVGEKPYLECTPPPHVPVFPAIVHFTRVAKEFQQITPQSEFPDIVQLN
jgi:hypothetical protein